MERADFDFQNPTALGKVIESKPHSLNKTQQMIQEQGGLVGASEAELGYTPLQPTRISRRRKNKQLAVQHMSAEEIDESEEEDDPPSKRTFVSNRL